ncbi:hypothetical protein LXL04_005020 [Taraxacum kok-saghyz]
MSLLVSLPTVATLFTATAFSGIYRNMFQAYISHCYSQEPKPQPIKYRGVEHLSDMLANCNQTSGILYYEVLNLTLPGVRGLKTLKVAFHHATKDEVVIHTIRLPKQSSIGDVAFRILETINSVNQRAIADTLEHDLQQETQGYVCDINQNLLDVGQKRAIKEIRLGEQESLIWVEGDAEKLKFENGSMDGYIIVFGIRNVTHIEKAIAETYRSVLKKGGRFLCLKLSHVEAHVFKQLYDYYSFSVIPVLRELVARDRDSYEYSVESVRRFPHQVCFVV